MNKIYKKSVNSSKIKEKTRCLSLLRNFMHKKGVDFFYISNSDFHFSEIIHPHFKFIEHLTGFSGSNAHLVIGLDDAALWTDGRYFLQVEDELSGLPVKLMRMNEPGVPSVENYISSNLKKNMTLGLDSARVTGSFLRTLKKIAQCNGFKIYSDFNPDSCLDIWERPTLTGKKVYEYPIAFSGCSSQKKISRILYVMDECGADYCLISDLSEIAWVLNLRGTDTPYSPLFFSFMLISHDRIYIYGFKEAFKDVTFTDNLVIKDYFCIFDDIKNIPKTSKIMLCTKSTSGKILENLPSKINVLDEKSPVAFLKSIKNEVEIENTRDVHIDDGIAVIRFIIKLKKAIGLGREINEYDCAGMINSLRAEVPDFKYPSFETISAYGPNGAIVHYAPSPESSLPLSASGFLLLDSGGQYMRGTTDITRTIALGPLTEKMKTCYTQVLKSHLALMSANFAPGTTGKELDEITRKPVKKAGYDYNHGTGHGVGHFLNVHEGPQCISRSNADFPIYPNMITTDEPGIYIENEFGIRIENELLCRSGNDGMLFFEPLTLVPYEKDAVIKELLTQDEIDSLNKYHRIVFSKISPSLCDDEREMLREMCLPI